jgi:hypothetical protein
VSSLGALESISILMRPTRGVILTAAKTIKVCKERKKERERERERERARLLLPSFLPQLQTLDIELRLDGSNEGTSERNKKWLHCIGRKR